MNEKTATGTDSGWQDRSPGTLCDLGVRRSGEGTPSLLLVHGYACAKDDWDGQIEALQDKFHCVALDLPGHGVSALPKEATVAAMAAAVNRVKAEIDGPVILVGHSMGCKVAREAFHAERTKVVGIVFIDGAFYDKEPDRMVAAARSRIDRDGFETFAKEHFADLFGSVGESEFRTRVIGRAASLHPDFGRDLYLSAVGFDATRGEETLVSIDVPALVLQSSWVDQDRVRRAMQPGVETPFMNRVSRLVPDNRIVTIYDSGHFPMHDQAARIAEELTGFAATLRDKAGSRRDG